MAWLLLGQPPVAVPAPDRPSPPSCRFLVQLTRPAVVQHPGAPGLPAVPRAPGGKLQLETAAARGYLRVLDHEQAEFLDALRQAIPEARLHWRYRVLWNGVAIRAPVGAAARLRGLPHVRSVRTTDRQLFRPTMDASLPLVGAPAYWAEVGGARQAGRSIKVAVIDTGIDVDNPMFDDPFVSYPLGYPRGATSYTTPKVIAARAYFRPDDPVDVTRDEPNPRDHLGHGSHVAGTIAGAQGTIFDLGGYEAVVSGVAPGAQLMSYKVFYRAESGTEGAHEPELMAAFEDAVLDGADVINNSWGGSDVFGDADPSLAVYGAAVDAGVVVVFAAGNEGPGSGSVGAPGQHPRFITVANAGTGRGFTRYLEVVAPPAVPSALQRVRMSVGSISASLGSGVGPSTLRSAHLVDSGSNETGCAPFSPGAFDGAVALVVRGGCSFSEKALQVADASAIAMVVQNDDPTEGPFAMSGDDVPIPAVMVSYGDGEALRAWCEAHVDAEAALRTGYVPYATGVGDEVTYSSSRGPTATSRLKPEIAAPGSPILSADAHRVGSSSTRPWDWKSGTSMASPHVAGAAALVRQRHPSWTPAQVKSALVGTARRAGVTSWVGGDAWPREMGGGRLQVDRLLDVRLLATPAVVDGVELAPGETRTVALALRRVEASLVGVTVRLENAAQHPDLELTIQPADGAAFDAGGEASLTLTVTAASGAEPGERSGWLVLEDDGGEETSVPFLLRVLPAEPTLDLLLVDLSFGSANSSPDYVARYEELATDLGLSWERAQVGSLYACPEVPQLARYRAVLVVTGDDRWSQYGVVARWTLDHLSTFLLRGGRLIVAGQGPLRDSSHDRVVALLGTTTLAERPWYDEATEGLRSQAEYRVTSSGEPALATAEVDLTSGSGELSSVGELTRVMAQADVDPWSRPVLRLTDGVFQGWGDTGMVYDPFPQWGLDRLAEAHRHRAVVLGFGLELVREPEPTEDGTPQPGSAGEILQRAFQWVSDRVHLAVEPTLEERHLTLQVEADADSGPVTSFWFDPGDGSEPEELDGGPVMHQFPAYGRYEVTLVARSATGAAALWRQWLDVQPAPPGADGGVTDGGITVDASGDATVIEGKRQGCHCQGSPGASGLLFWPLLAFLLWRRRGGARRRARLHRLSALTVGLAVVGGAGCDREAGKLKDAYEEVIDYSREYNERHTVWKAKKLPGYVWAVRENRDTPERPSVDVDISVPMGAPVEVWKTRLTEAVRAAQGASTLEVVRVQAWPEGLVAFGGVLGNAHFAKDGRGWDGRGNTMRGVKVLLGQDKDVWRPSAFDLVVLQALERRRRILLKDPTHKRRWSLWARRPELLERDVVTVVAPRLGLTTGSIDRTVANARKFFWKPAWQPLPVPRGQ